MTCASLYLINDHCPHPCLHRALPPGRCTSGVAAAERQQMPKATHQPHVCKHRAAERTAGLKERLASGAIREAETDRWSITDHSQPRPYTRRSPRKSAHDGYLFTIFDPQYLVWKQSPMPEMDNCMMNASTTRIRTFPRFGTWQLRIASTLILISPIVESMTNSESVIIILSSDHFFFLSGKRHKTTSPAD